MCLNAGAFRASPYHVHTEQRVMVNLREQLLLVLKLKVRPQPRVQRLPKHPALRIVVHPFWMQETRHSPFSPNPSQACGRKKHLYRFVCCPASNG